MYLLQKMFDDPTCNKGKGTHKKMQGNNGFANMDDMYMSQQIDQFLIEPPAKIANVKCY